MGRATFQKPALQCRTISRVNNLDLLAHQGQHKADICLFAGSALQRRFLGDMRLWTVPVFHLRILGAIQALGPCFPNDTIEARLPIL